jgi:hypothetical protein
LAEEWLCQIVDNLGDRVQRIEGIMDALDMRTTDQRARLRGATWEVSEEHIAQWTVGSTLPLGATDSYVRFVNGSLEIRGGQFDIHTGEAGAHMTLDASELLGYDGDETLTIHLDWDAGTLWAIKGGFGGTEEAPLIVLNADGTATIAGWDINEASLSKNNATLSSTGVLTLGTANDVVISSAADATYRLWVGHATAGSAPFRVQKNGSFVATSATITGTITATAGSIGGWVIAATSLADAAGVVGMSSAVTGGDDIRFWAGHATPASAPFKVTEAGILTASGAILSGTMSSVPFTSGVEGWQIHTNGNAEFNDVTVRGRIRSAVFEYNIIQATSGSIAVAKSAGVLAANFEIADGSGTLTVQDPPSGEAWLFESNDIVRIRYYDSGVLKESWLTVTRTGTVNEYTTALENGTDDYTYKKGLAVINYGPATQGLLFMTADADNSPYYDVRTHAGAPWTTQTAKVRLGNLAGITDATFGALTGYGLWTDSGYFTGSIKSQAGEIAGWTLAADNISKNNATLHSSGYILLGTGDDVARLDAANATYRLWIGDATAADAPFSVTKAGAVVATSATITGTITATAGAIASWTINADNIASANATLHSDGYLLLGTGDDVARLDAANATYRLWIGDADATDAPFTVDKTGICLIRTSGAANVYFKIVNTTLTDWPNHFGFMNYEAVDVDAGHMNVGCRQDADNQAAITFVPDAGYSFLSVQHAGDWYYPLTAAYNAVTIGSGINFKYYNDIKIDRGGTEYTAKVPITQMLADYHLASNLTLNTGWQTSCTSGAISVPAGYIFAVAHASMQCTAWNKINNVYTIIYETTERARSRVSFHSVGECLTPALTALWSVSAGSYTVTLRHVNTEDDGSNDVTVFGHATQPYTQLSVVFFT